MDFAPENAITNAEFITNHFGYWPSFHDAEILSITFERPRDKSNSTARMKVYAFEMTDRLKGRFFKLVKHCIIEFELTALNGNEFDGFNHQNAVEEILFGGNEEYLFCKINAAYGIDGYLEAREIKVVSLEPVTDERLVD
jgi:hypothetical protein